MFKKYAQALGLTEFILPSDFQKNSSDAALNIAINPSTTSGVQKFRFIFISQHDFSTEQKNMFEKLRSAMGLDQKNAPLFIGEIKDNIKAQKYIQFDINPEIVHLDSVLIIPHPKIMIEKPELKKPVWEELKKLISSK